MVAKFKAMLIELSEPLCTCMSMQKPSKGAYEIFLPSGSHLLTVRCKTCKAELKVPDQNLSGSLVYTKPKAKNAPRDPLSELEKMILQMVGSSSQRLIDDVEKHMKNLDAQVKNLEAESGPSTSSPWVTTTTTYAHPNAAEATALPEKPKPSENPQTFRPAYMKHLNLESTE